MTRLLSLVVFGIATVARPDIAAAASSGVETLFLKGTIAQGNQTQLGTVDTYGLFSAPGTDLKGYGVSFYIQYIPSVFGKPSKSGQNTVYRCIVSARKADCAGSLIIVIDIAGVTQTIGPDFNYSAVSTTSQTPVSVTLVAPLLQSTQGFNASGISLQLSSPYVFGTQFNSSMLLFKEAVNLLLFQSSKGSQQEGLGFEIQSAHN